MTPEDMREIKSRMEELKKRKPLEILVEAATIRDILNSNMTLIGLDVVHIPKLTQAWVAIAEIELRILGVPKPGIGGTSSSPIPIDSSSVVIRTIDEHVPRGTSDVHSS